MGEEGGMAQGGADGGWTQRPGGGTVIMYASGSMPSSFWNFMFWGFERFFSIL
jgi:hypothetical protein